MARFQRTIILPARLESSRFPGKLLYEIEGRSILNRTLDQALQSKIADRIIVATDNEAIARHAKSSGIEVAFTMGEFQCGTDRCAEVVRTCKIDGLVVNLQADELFISPKDIDRVFRALLKNKKEDIVSLMRQMDEGDAFNFNAVKVICDETKYAKDFLRIVKNNGHSLFHHIGIYGFHVHNLLQSSELPLTALEVERKLEQMRWLEHGKRIRMLKTKHGSISVNTHADIDKASKYLKKQVQ